MTDELFKVPLLSVTDERSLVDNVFPGGYTLMQLVETNVRG